MEWDGGVVGGKVKRSVLFFLFRLHGSGVLDISSYLSLTLTYTSLPYLLFFLCNTLIVFLCSFLYLFLIARGGSLLGGMWGGRSSHYYISKYSVSGVGALLVGLQSTELYKALSHTLVQKSLKPLFSLMVRIQQWRRAD